MMKQINKVSSFKKKVALNSRVGLSAPRLSILVLTLLWSARPFFGQTSPQDAPVAKSPLKTWIDPITNHRVTRLSDDPNSRTLYFDDNAYTPDGLDMVYVSPKGLYDLNLSTLESKLLVRGRLSSIVVATKTRRVFYQNDSDGYYYAVDIDTSQAVRLHPLPFRAVASSVNSDETLLVGTVVEGNAPLLNQYKLQSLQDAHKALVDSQKAVVDAGGDSQAYSAAKSNQTKVEAGWAAKAKADAEQARFDAHEVEDIFTINLSTGEVKMVLRGTDWLNHVQFSPTDPTLIMYAHEGPAIAVDRVWTIRADGSQNQLIHRRADPNEIATHEFWSHDGKTIWYDLQTTKGVNFELAGFNVANRTSTIFRLTKADASIHYNVASDGSVFCGDGNQVAHGDLGSHGHLTLDRRWIELLKPSLDGTLQSLRLASLASNDYAKTEPNVRFSPDNKLVIFTSNIFGPDYVFAVEVDKTENGDGAAGTTTN